MEAVSRVPHLFLSRLVPGASDLARIHTVSEVEGGRDVDIVEQRKVAADWYIVLHAVFPVLDKIGVHELVFLGVDRVAELSGIAHRDLLIPFLVAHLMLAAEGIEA